MFEKIIAFLKGLLHTILPNPDWKKMGWAAGLGLVSFFVLRFLLPAVLSQWGVALIGAGLVGWLIYTRVAMWEIERALKEVKDLAAKAGVKL